MTRSLRMIRSGLKSSGAHDDPAARGAHGRVGAAVGEHGDLAVGAEVAGRADGDRVVDPRAHRLERLVEVDPVVGEVEAWLERRRPRSRWPGGTRPPAPIRTGAGNGLPVETTVIVGAAELGRRQVGRARAAGPELDHRGGDAERVTDGDRRRRAGEDEDALRRRRARVRGRVLQVEAVGAQRRHDARTSVTFSPACGESVGGALDVVDRHRRRRGRRCARGCAGSGCRR